MVNGLPRQPGGSRLLLSSSKALEDLLSSRPSFLGHYLE